MCCDEDKPGEPLSFAKFVSLLQQPPFEPCESELQFLTDAEYLKLFSETWRLYFRPVRQYLAHLMEDRETAADLTQKLFISLYYRRASFAPAYIYRAAKYTAYSEFRRRSREGRALRAFWRGIKPDRRVKAKEVEASDPHLLPDAVLIERAREEALRRAVEILPEPFRVPLRLFAESKTYRQIMTITQTNEGTVKSRICRGKALLRRKLRGYL
jgi:RNA polymerase sigma-70 factor, ECF subfamily